MADLQGTNITKGRVGANVLAAGDGISGLLITATVPVASYGKVFTLYNPNDIFAVTGALASEEYSGTSQHLYRHIQEFYRIAGEGQKLYVMLVEPAQPMSALLNMEGFAKKMLTLAKGEIKQLAIAVNPALDSTNAYINGLPTAVFNSIAPAQAVADWAFENHMPLNILLEGYSYNGPAASAGDLRDIEELSAHKVSVVIGQDYNYVRFKPPVRQKFADVGTALGTVAAAKVSQNIGDNEAFNLTNAATNTWVEPGLSSHVKTEDVYSDLQTLEDKGYIFGLNYVGMDGVRWNNDHVCAPIVQDAEGNINEHTIAYGRTHDKSLRLMRTALLPKVKGSHAVDPKTGKLTIGLQKYFEGIGNEVYAGMVRRSEISAGQMTVDINSDLITEKVLKTSYKIVPYGTIGEITGTSNLKQSL